MGRSETGEENVEGVGERIAMFVHQGGDTLSHLGQSQGRQGLRHEDMVSAVDGNDRVEVGDWFAQNVERDQGDDNARPHFG